MHKGLWYNSNSFGKVYEPGPLSGGNVEEIVRSEPEAPAPEPEPPAHAGVLLLNEIGQAHPSEALRAEQSELLSECLALNERVATFLHAIAEEREANLSLKVEALQMQCRAQSTVCQNLRNEVSRADNMLATVVARRHQELLMLKSLQLATPNPDSWPTASQMEASSRRIEAARTKLAEIQQEENACLAEYNRLVNKLEEERAKISGLALDEKRSRYALEGKPLEDPELGLTAVPGA